VLRGDHGRPARLVWLLVSDLTAETARAGTDTGAPVLARLSTLDRFLPVWIVAAMAVGIALGRALPGLDDALDAVQVGSVSLPIAVGLLLMMYPVLAKVRYGELGTVTGDRRLLIASLVLNWLVGPALMFALAWLLLPDLPAYRTGLIIVGLARCIAMVLIWNDLSCGDREAGAVLVAINSVFQIVAFAALGYFYLQLLPGWIGLSKTALDVSVWDIAKSSWSSSASRCSPASSPAPSASGPAAATGTSRGFCPGSARSRSTACCSPSSCCSRYRAPPSPASRWRSCGSRCRCWRTSC